MRVEQKFTINFHQYYELREAIRFMGSVDKYAQNGNSYPVFSQYFDTRNLDLFYDKVNGEYEHIKVRKRKYAYDLLDEDGVFVEGKLKHKDVIFKYREPFEEAKKKSLDNTDLFCSNGFFSWISTKTPLYPVCNVFYIREAYFIPFKSEMIRLNFDQNITFLLPNEKKLSRKLSKTRAPLDGTIVMEIKGSSYNFPDYLKELLLKIGAKKTRFSKYASCMTYLQKIDFHWEEIG